MDWADFFERTRVAAKVDSFSKLAPKVGITDGAIHHYRTGNRIPQVWVVADCLRVQGHPEPEKAAIQIMKDEARTPTERTFWKRLAATAMTLVIGVSLALPVRAEAVLERFEASPSIHYAKWRIGRHDREFVWSGFGSSLACQITPLAKRNSQH